MERTHRTSVILLFLTLAACQSTPRGGRVACTPGEDIRVGCSEEVGRACSGRPTLSVCDGVVDAEDCTPATPSPPSLGVDRPPSCPQLTVTCPASGSIVAQPSGEGFWACTWATAPRVIDAGLLRDD